VRVGGEAPIIGKVRVCETRSAGERCHSFENRVKTADRSVRPAPAQSGKGDSLATFTLHPRIAWVISCHQEGLVRQT
jgi:hypothetical protein